MIMKVQFEHTNNEYDLKGLILSAGLFGITMYVFDLQMLIA